MTLQELIDALNLQVLTEPKDFTAIYPSGGYVSDLLSCVMAGAPRQGIWVTLQAHLNIIAVAALLDLCAVIITEGAEPDPATINRANSEGITLLSTQAKSYSVVGRMWQLGIKGE